MASQTPDDLVPASDIKPSPKNYWQQAFNALGATERENLSKLPEKFDKETQDAIKELQKRKSDDDTQSILCRIKERLDSKALSYQAKGKIRQIAAQLNFLNKKLNEEVLAQLRDFQDEFGSATSNESRDGIHGALDDLLQICEQNLEISRTKQWKYKRLDEEKPIHELWASALDRVDKVKAVMDSIMSAEPTARLVWSALNVALQVAITAEKNAMAILDGFDAAVRMIGLGLEHERFLHQGFDGQTISGRSASFIENALVSTYLEVIKFLAIAASIFEKGSVGQRWYAFWCEKDVLTFKQKVVEIEVRLHHDLGLAQQDQLKGELSKIHDTHNRLESELSEINNTLNSFGIDAHRDKVLAWYSSLAQKDVHKSKSEPRLPNTANWVFGLEEYMKWKEDPESPFLWIRGMLGTGKTVLMSNIIETHLSIIEEGKKPVQHTNEDPGFVSPGFQMAYFYFRRGDPDANSCDKALGSCIKQLATTHDTLPHNVQRFYRLKGNPAAASQKLFRQDYQVIFDELISRKSETIFFFDALDECMKPEEVFDMLRHILGVTPEGKALGFTPTVKVVLTSRDDLSLIEAAEQEPSLPYGLIEVTNDHNGRDIKCMVTDQIQAKLNEVKKTRPTQLKDWEEVQPSIEANLTEKSLGMFQWASLHIKSLMGAKRPSYIEGMLEKLPKGMTATYNGIFKQILRSNYNDFEMASKAFKWLLALGGSCEVEVFLPAVCQNLETQEPTKVDCTLDDVIMCCESLIKKEGSKILFCHLSVQEYCEGRITNDPNEQETAARNEIMQQFEFQQSRLLVAKVCFWMPLHYELPTYVQVERSYGHDGTWCYRSRPTRGPSIDESTRYLDILSRFACENWEIYLNKLEHEGRAQIAGFLCEPGDLDPSRFNGWSLRLAIDQMPKFFDSIGATSYLEGDEPKALRSAVLRSPWMRLRIQGFQTDCSSLSHYLFPTKETERESYMELRAESKAVGAWRGQNWSLLMDATLAGIFKESSTHFKTVLGFKKPSDLVGCFHIDQADFQGTNPSTTISIIARTLIRFLVGFVDGLNTPRDLSSWKTTVFSDAFIEGSDIQCVTEIALLTSFLLCVNDSFGHHWTLGGSNDDDSNIEWLHDKFDCDGIDRHEDGKYSYRYLVLPYIDIDWPAILEIVNVRSPLHKTRSKLVFGHVDKEVLLHTDRVSRSNPLINAILQDNLYVVDWLLKNMYDINPTTHRSDYGHPLIAAFSKGPAEQFAHQDQIRRLIMDHEPRSIHYVATSGIYGTPLITACSKGDFKTVEDLLVAQVDPNQVSSLGTNATALIAASSTCFIPAVRKLLEYGARPFLQIPFSGNQGQDALVRALGTGVPRLVHLLCRDGGRQQGMTIPSPSNSWDERDPIRNRCRALAMRLSWFIATDEEDNDLVGNLKLIVSLKRDIPEYGRKSIRRCLAEAFGFDHKNDLILNAIETTLRQTADYCATWDQAAPYWSKCIAVADQSVWEPDAGYKELLEFAECVVPPEERLLLRIPSEPVRQDFYQLYE